MIPHLLGLPTDTSHVAGGPVDLPSPHPLGINYHPVNLLGLPSTDSQLTRRLPVGGFAYWPSLNDGRCSSCLSHFSAARNSMLHTEKFFRVWSLASLVDIPREKGGVWVLLSISERISPWALASSLEQAVSLLCAQANSASYRQRDGKWVVAYGLRGEGLAWLIGVVVYLSCCTAGPIVRCRGQWMAA